MKSRKLISLLLAAVMLVGTMTGCGQSDPVVQDTPAATETATKKEPEAAAETEKKAEAETETGVKKVKIW